ncbi:hypothetical protein HmCmsJML134_03915 [Escherichia coli]|nr:hypothetical protein HmCmsJML134_03915 [Escherichia coli]
MVKKILFRIRRIFGEIHQVKQIFTIERKEVFYKITETFYHLMIVAPENSQTVMLPQRQPAF